MFGTIRKHQRWLWVIIITLTIISFVWFFQPNTGGGRGSGDAAVGTLDGTPVNISEVRDAARQAELSGFLRFGAEYKSPQAERAGFVLKNETMQRLFLGNRIREYKIQVSDAAIARWIQEYLKDPRTGAAVNYDNFVATSLRSGGFTSDDFLEFVRYSVGMQELERLVGITGKLVTPQEAEADFRRANEVINVTLAYFPGSNFLAGVVVDDAKLGQFFTNRLAQYRIPERTTLTYLRFDLTNFLAAAEAKLATLPELNTQVEAMYQQRGADAFRDASNNPLSKEAALAQIREQFVRQQAGQLALAQATEFVNELGQMEPMVAANLTTLAQKKGLTVQQSLPFVDGDRPFGLDDVRSLPEAVRALSPAEPFVGPISGTRGVVVAALGTRAPSMIPSFETMRARVDGDFRIAQSTEAARAAGRAFQAAATNAIAQGKSIADAAGPSVRLTELSFSLSSPSVTGLDPRINPAQIKNAAFLAKPGTLTEFLPTADGGFVLYVRERKPVDDATAKTGLATFLTELRTEREREAFGAWYAEQYQKSGAAALAKNVGL